MDLFAQLGCYTQNNTLSSGKKSSLVADDKDSISDMLLHIVCRKNKNKKYTYLGCYTQNVSAIVTFNLQNFDSYSLFTYKHGKMEWDQFTTLDKSLVKNAKNVTMYVTWRRQEGTKVEMSILV